MTAVKGCLKIPFWTARSRVLANRAPSASWATMRARIRLKVVAPIPSDQSSTPMAAFQSESTRVRREVSASEVRSWVAHSMARTITDGGTDGRPLPGCVQVGEVLVRDDLVAVVGQALVERALGHQVRASHGEFLTVNLGGQPVRALTPPPGKWRTTTLLFSQT